MGWFIGIVGAILMFGFLVNVVCNEMRAAEEWEEKR